MLLTSAAWGQEDALPTGFDEPGPKPVEVLPAILTELRRTMRDPYSIRDFAICDPQVTEAFKYPGAGQRWERAHWTVKFVLNAKNSYGGYAGLTYFSATYQNGQLQSVSSPNLGPELNAKLVDLARDCPRVPDAEIQRLLAL
jgi:hypothetical protein